ncbi:MAG: sugar ABC transporter permease, partial [Pseudomonadota bacterium]
MTDAALSPADRFEGAKTGSPNSKGTSRQRAWAPWLFLAPGVIFFAAYVVIPIAQSVSISFYQWDGLGEKVFIGLGNYIELLDDDAFYTSLWNNVLWLVFFLLAIPFGLFTALYLNQTVFGIRLVKSLFFFPFVISQVVVGLVFAWFYDPTFGLLAEIFRFFGLQPISILAEDRLVTFGIIAAGLWPQTAYCMILY